MMPSMPDPQVLAAAQDRQRQGRSLFNSEAAALRAFAKIKTANEKAAKRAKISVYDTSTNMLAGKDTLQAPGAADANVIRAIVAAGGVFTEFVYCDSGSPATAWWPIWTSDPS